MTAREGSPQWPGTRPIHRGRTWGTTRPGHGKTKEGKERTAPEAKKAGVAKEIGACAYRATSVDTKDKKRIVSSKVFQNPAGFIHRQEGTFNIPGPA